MRRLDLCSQVRNERNLAREEIKQLQTKLDCAIKESNTYHRQRLNLEVHNEQMRKELEQIHLLLLKHVGKNVFIQSLRFPVCAMLI